MAARKTSSGKGKSSKKTKEPESRVIPEIILLIILAISLLLFISNVGLGGVVGKAVRSLGFGLFGLLTYVFPVGLFLGSAFCISNYKNSLVYKKTAAGICTFILAGGMAQLLTEGYMKSTSFLDYYKISSEYHTGGGLVGGAVCKVFCNAFGVLGAYILMTILLIIFLILVTQRSFFSFVMRLCTGIASLFGGERKKPAKAARGKSKKPAVPKEEKKLKSKKDGTVYMQLLDDIRTEMPRADKKKKTEEEVYPIQRNESAVEEEPVKEEPAEVEVTKKAPADEEESLSFVKPEEETPLPFTPEEAKKPSEEKKKIPQKPGSATVNGIPVERGGKTKAYKYPPLSLLKSGGKGKQGDSDAHLRETAKKLQETLHNFGVNVTVTNISCGPTVTRYELQPEQGVKVSRIVGLADDIKLNLAAADIRIEAPIPGKAAVGIEVPNKENSAVMLRDLLASAAFKEATSKLAFAAGKDIAGQPVVTDIAKMPHLLIAGATGSGKSVCINTLIMSILYKASPEEVKLIMIDPKVVELSVYNGIPHLYIPVVTDPKKAAGALNWAVAEMTNRYNLFAKHNVRGLVDYNAKIAAMEPAEGEEPAKKLPQIVIIVDELADLMMVAPGEVEDAICRLAQLARAAGIHLIIATQRPSVNVITGLIKANMPSRIAFAVSSGVDSRTILDMHGAEKLLGKGDMLFYPQGYPKPARLQGAFVSDEEVSKVVEFLAAQNLQTESSDEIEQKITSAASSSGAAAVEDERDVHFVEAGKFIIEKDKASIGMLQRMFKIGFNRAARVMDQLAEAGVVGPEEGTKPRKILMTMEEFNDYVEKSV